MSTAKRSRIDRFQTFMIEHVYWLLTLLVVLLACVLYAVMYFLRPAPPSAFVFASGPQGGAYQRFAEEYRDRLKRHGVQIVIEPSSGSVQNLERLRDPNSRVDAAFIQGGVAFTPAPDEDEQKKNGDEEIELRSLGSMYYEPLWIFYRSDRPLDRLDQLAGKRLAIGEAGSGTRKVALDLLALSRIGARNATLLEIPTTEAVRALRAGEIDALFAVAGAEAPSVQTLLREPGVSLMSLAQAGGYVRRLAYLSTVTLARGVIDFPANIPERDITMLAATATLVVRESMHPALVYLLLDAANAVHKRHGVFSNATDFPSPQRQDLPLADEAERYYKTGKPFLQRYLPYWLANFIDRVWVLLVPLLAVAIPVLKFFPGLYGLRVKMRVGRWYRELAEIERDVGDRPDPSRIAEFVEELDDVERRINGSGISDMYAQDLYSLRATIDLVRERLGAPHAKAVPVLRGGS